MQQPYNPIVRTFGQIRAALLSSGDVARRDIRPDTPLEWLLPESERREAWRGLRRHGLRVPGLELPPRERLLTAFEVVRTSVSLLLWLQRWSALLLALPVGLAAYWASRPRAMVFPLGLRTVGELVLYLTSFREHQESGYRWTHNEISFKVRLIVAECLGHTLDHVRPESTLAELGAE
jgi:hypothetical protein